jgi:hypothetical protein
MQGTGRLGFNVNVAGLINHENFILVPSGITDVTGYSYVKNTKEVCFTYENIRIILELTTCGNAALDQIKIVM